MEVCFEKEKQCRCIRQASYYRWVASGEVDLFYQIAGFKLSRSLEQVHSCRQGSPCRWDLILLTCQGSDVMSWINTLPDHNTWENPYCRWIVCPQMDFSKVQDPTRHQSDFIVTQAKMLVAFKEVREHISWSTGRILNAWWSPEPKLFGLHPGMKICTEVPVSPNSFYVLLSILVLFLEVWVRH